MFFSYDKTLGKVETPQGTMTLKEQTSEALLNIEGEVLDDAAQYFSICMQFSFLPALFVIISSIFKSYFPTYSA